MMAADVARDSRRRFVLAADCVAGETEIERVDGSSRNARGERGDDAGIDAAAHKRAERHIGYQHRFDGARQLGIQRIDGKRTFETMLGHVRWPPEHAGRELPVPHRQPMPGRQLAYVPIDAVRRRNVLALEVKRERVEIDRAGQPRERQQRLDLRTEYERARVPCVIQGLHTEMIAGQEQHLAIAIP